MISRWNCAAASRGRGSSRRALSRSSRRRGPGCRAPVTPFAIRSSRTRRCCAPRSFRAFSQPSSATFAAGRKSIRLFELGRVFLGGGERMRLAAHPDRRCAARLVVRAGAAQDRPVRHQGLHRVPRHRGARLRARVHRRPSSRLAHHHRRPGRRNARPACAGAAARARLPQPRRGFRARPRAVPPSRDAVAHRAARALPRRHARHRDHRRPGGAACADRGDSARRE